MTIPTDACIHCTGRVYWATKWDGKDQWVHYDTFNVRCHPWDVDVTLAEIAQSKDQLLSEVLARTQGPANV